MKPIIYNGRNFCSIITAKYTAYYGKDEVDPITQDWCMTVKKNDKEVFRASNELLLEVAAGESPVDMLVAGLALYFLSK